MKICILASILFLFTGCVGIEGTRTAPDGSVLTIKANRFLWVSQKMEFTTEAEGVKVSLRADKSSSDSQAIAALAAIAATAAKAP
jgi:hypothetical protein